MGFSYDMRGRLACDQCSTTGGVRRKACPFGWCQATALCATCRAKPENRAEAWKADHLDRGCEAAALRFADEQAVEAAMLPAGLYVRRSAINEGDAVRVTFVNEAGDRQSLLVTTESYRAVGLGTPATAADFEVFAETA